MDGINTTNKATEVFNDLCTTLDNRNWKYKKFPEDLVISFVSMGDDLPMEFVIIVDEERQIIRILSPILIEDNKNNRLDMAIAACAASYGLSDGSFDYNIVNGELFFRLTASFRNSKIGEGLFAYLIACSGLIVDKYNEKFFALSKGILSLEDFLNIEG